MKCKVTRSAYHNGGRKLRGASEGSVVPSKEGGLKPVESEEKWIRRRRAVLIECPAALERVRIVAAETVVADSDALPLAIPREVNEVCSVR